MNGRILASLFIVAGVYLLEREAHLAWGQGYAEGYEESDRVWRKLEKDKAVGPTEK